MYQGKNFCLRFCEGYIRALATCRTTGYNSSRLLLRPMLLYWGRSWCNVWFSISLRLSRIIWNVMRFGCRASAMWRRVTSDTSLTDASCKPKRKFTYNLHSGVTRAVTTQHRIQTSPLQSAVAEVPIAQYHAAPVVAAIVRLRLLVPPLHNITVTSALLAPPHSHASHPSWSQADEMICVSAPPFPACLIWVTLNLSGYVYRSQLLVHKPEEQEVIFLHLYNLGITWF